jgi:hypothetical protein
MAKSRSQLESEINKLSLSLRREVALRRLITYIGTGYFFNEFSSSALAFVVACEEKLGIPHQEVPSTSYMQTLVYAAYDNGYPPGNLSDFDLDKWLYKGL